MPDFLLNLTPHEYAIASTSLYSGIAITALLFLILFAIEAILCRKGQTPAPVLADSEFVALTKIVVDALNGFGERLNQMEDDRDSPLTFRSLTELTEEESKADEVLARNVPGYAVPKFENTDPLAKAMRKHVTRSAARKGTKRGGR